MSGATVQMYAVGTASEGAASTPLFATPPTTDSSGKFDFAGVYSCPGADALVYLVATGGDPGTTAGRTNPQLSMMSVLGRCGDITPTTSVTINEATTVAAVWALNQFMHSATAIGSSSNNAAALAAGFKMAMLLVNPATGTSPGANAPSDIAPLISQINTLANILASCVDSPGGVAGDGSSCGKLFQSTTATGTSAPTDVIGAALALANNPSQNVSQLFALTPSSPPFQPALSAPPATFTLPVIPTGLSVTPALLSFQAMYLLSHNTQSLLVKNNGSAAVQIASIGIVGGSASEFSYDVSSPQSPCSVSTPLAAGATCTILVTFSPATAGQKTTELQIASNAPNSLISVPLSGQGVTPTSSSFTLAPSSLTFTKAGVPQTVTLTNVGPGALFDGHISVSSALGNITETDNCTNLSNGIPSSSTCTISVLATSLTPDASTGSITVSMTAGGTLISNTVPVSLPASGVNFSTTPLDFGDWAVGVPSTPASVSVNSGDAGKPAPPLSSKGVSGPNAADFVPGQNCSSGTYECRLSITFKPSATGARTATLATEYGNVVLRGNGLASGPAFTVSPYTPLSVPALTSQSETITVTNNGDKQLLLTASLEGGSDFSSSSGCSAALDPGKTCPITITFSPTVTGQRTGTLTIKDSTSGIERTLSLSGTGLQGTGNPPPGAKNGLVQGGLLPVSGATVQMYAVGNTGEGSHATPLFSTPLTTDSEGKFAFAGAYACPSEVTLVYMVATGGNPGVGAVNPQLSMMTVLGRCGDLTATTKVVINEATTVASVWALAPFISSPDAIGATDGNGENIAAAFSSALMLVNPATGVVPGVNPPANTTLPVRPLYTLANILSSCVESTGGVAGDNSPCGKLFQYATTPGGSAPTDTIGVILSIVGHPTQNVDQIFGLLPASSPFQGNLDLAPTSFVFPGFNPGISPSGPGTLVFSDAYVSTKYPQSQTFSLKNYGSSPIQISFLKVLGAGFSLVDQSISCNAGSLAGGATCTISVAFSPVTAGPQLAFLQILSNASNPSVLIPLSGRGISLPPNTFTVTPGSLTFTKAGLEQTLTVTNSGIETAYNVNIVGTSPHNNLYLNHSSCSDSLAAGHVCTIGVGTMSLTPDANSGSITVSANLGGAAISDVVKADFPASGVNFSSAPVNFGDWGVGVTSLPMVVKVTSADSTKTPTPPHGTITGPGPGASDFSIDSETCSDGECRIAVLLTPGALGGRLATLSTDYGDVPLSGNGITGASFIFSPYTPLSVLVFAGQLEDVTVTNNGDKPLSLTTYANFNSDFPYASGCAGNLDKGASCALSVGFYPRSVGQRTGQITVTDRTSGLTKILNVSGTGLPVPPQVGPAALDFGLVQVGVASAPQSVSVQVPLNDHVTFVPDSTGNANSDFSLGTTECSGPCTKNIVFTPSAPGLRTSVIVVTDTLTKLTKTFSLQGTGGNPLTVISPSSLSYTTEVGTGQVQAVTVKNNGVVPLGLTKINLAGANADAFVIQSNTCSTIAPATSCTIPIIFQPLAQGAFNAVLQLTTNDPATPVATVALSGTGSAPTSASKLVVSPTSLSFPDVYLGGGSPLQAVTVTNNSSYAMAVQFTSLGDGDFVVGDNYCYVLQPGGSCRISVQFAPTAVGARSAILKAADANAGYTASIAVSGNGIATSGGPLVLSPSSLTFDKAGVPQTVSLINGGQTAVTIEKIDGDNGNNCGAVLAVGAACEISVQASSKTTSVQNYTVSVLASSSATSYTLPVTVTATTDSTNFTTTVMGFGSVPVGTSKVQSFYVSGFKFMPPIIPVITGPNTSDFSSPGNSCTDTYIINCEAQVTFAPQASGLRTATLATAWGNIELYGVGGDDGADFTITPNDFPPTIVPGYVGSITVTNTGSAPLVLGPSAQIPNYSFDNDECGGRRLEVGVACTVKIAFHANSGTGQYPTTVGYTDIISGISRTLALNGDAGPQVDDPVVTPSSLTFPNVEVNGTGDVQNISVTQAEGHPVTVKLSSTDFLVNPGSCAQGTPCQIGVRFHPSRAGSRSATLTVTDPVTAGTARTNLVGVGGFPQISIAPSSIDFPTQVIGSTWDNQSLTITNAGDSMLNLKQITLSGANASDFTFDSSMCGNQVFPNSSCQIAISFVPRALGERSATLQITSDSKTSSVLNVPISASSTAAP